MEAEEEGSVRYVSNLMVEDYEQTNPTFPYVSAPSDPVSSTALSQYSDPVRNPYTQEIPSSFYLYTKQPMSAYFFSPTRPQISPRFINPSRQKKTIKDKKTNPTALQPPTLDSVVFW